MTSAMANNFNIADTSLVIEAKRGNQLAFDSLVQRYYQAIFRFAYSRLRQEDDAMDVAQETFLRIYKCLHQLKKPETFKSWIYKIAANVSIDIGRRRSKQKLLLEELRDVTHSPEKNKELIKEIQAGLQTLGPREKSAVELTLYVGYTQREAAELLDCAENTVAWYIYKAKEKLKNFMLH